MIADIVALDLSRGKAAQRLSWPRTADVIVLGSRARRACGAALARTVAGPGGRPLSLLSHSPLHSASLLSERVLARFDGDGASARTDAQAVSRIFSHPLLSADLDNLLLVGANRHGRRDALCVLACDVGFLPRPYGVALAVLKAIEDGRIVAKAVPLLDGFRHVTDSPAYEAYKHPGGVRYEMMALGEPRVLRDRLELALGQESFAVRPVYEK